MDCDRYSHVHWDKFVIFSETGFRKLALDDISHQSWPFGHFGHSLVVNGWNPAVDCCWSSDISGGQRVFAKTTKRIAWEPRRWIHESSSVFVEHKTYHEHTTHLQCTQTIYETATLSRPQEWRNFVNVPSSHGSFLSKTDISRTKNLLFFFSQTMTISISPPYS